MLCRFNFYITHHAHIYITCRQWYICLFIILLVETKHPCLTFPLSSYCTNINLKQILYFYWGRTYLFKIQNSVIKINRYMWHYAPILPSILSICLDANMTTPLFNGYLVSIKLVLTIIPSIRSSIRKVSICVMYCMVYIWTYCLG